ncbi:hypothetical protein OPV22_023856 [Ensete ventricosum]|uniref:Uncharacterized protein n=1 Tax=Ensete ventricosum TaxID=4639 RepID=A0AAV8QXP0_ENSVE|nr:hypothetical protein OPV22_023856 [Ensete ventricosum]
MSLRRWKVVEIHLVLELATGICTYGRHKQKTNVHIMALNLIKDVPLRNRVIINGPFLRGIVSQIDANGIGMSAS